MLSMLCAACAGKSASAATPPAATTSANVLPAASSPGLAQGVAGAAAAEASPAEVAPPAHQLAAEPEPMDYSTMAQDVGGLLGGPGDTAPEPTLLSGQQPSSRANQQRQLAAAAGAAHSSGFGPGAPDGGAGAGAESVQANGDATAPLWSGGGEVAQPAAPGGGGGSGCLANGDTALDSQLAAAAAHGYASSIILGNGFLGDGGSALEAAAAAAVAVAAGAGGGAATSELTSPSLGTSASGKRSKRKRT